MWSRILVLLLLISACSAPPPPPPVAEPSELALGTDMAWAQLTVALNERALKTFSLVRERAADAGLVALAGELTSAHTQENARLNALLARIGAPAENPHATHDMPGMATAEQITSMAAARGEAFDTLFVESLRRHLTQCQDLAHSMLQAGRLPDALDLAAAIESSRQQALARLTPHP
jgi:uncharacterized protein (DUF305 family)